jgi:S-methylmethionine-dependent homocysteine/selenocysteine methylase
MTLGKSKISLLMVKHMLAAIGRPDGVSSIHELNTALSVLSKAWVAYFSQYSTADSLLMSYYRQRVSIYVKWNIMVVAFSTLPRIYRFSCQATCLLTTASEARIPFRPRQFHQFSAIQPWAYPNS